MKKIISAAVAVFMVAAVFCSLAISASAKTVSVTDICDYTITTVNAGFPHYRDSEGEEKLFDGVIPTKDELDEAAAAYEVAENKEWYVWEGWIGIHCTSADSYKQGSAVNIDFTFEREVNLSQIIPHSAAMATGNVSTPEKYQVYVSDDGTNWTLINETECENPGIWNEYGFDDTIITLDEPVTTKYMRLVADGLHCWWFCSEVELYEEQEDEVIVTPSEEPSSEEPAESEKPTEPTADSGIVALAVIAALAVVGAVVVKKTR